MAQLSKAQQRYLSEIREAGWKVYNGRASRTLEILADQGLIRTEWFFHKGDQGKIIKEVHCAVDARTELDPVQLLMEHHSYLFPYLRTDKQTVDAMDTQGTGLKPTLAELMASQLAQLLERWQVHAPEVQIIFSPTKVEMITDVGMWEYALSDPIRRMVEDFEYYHIEY